MAVDKLVDSTQLDADLTSVANAIRTKGGTSAQLAFPADFVQAIEAIPTGGGDEEVLLGSGDYTVASDLSGISQNFTVNTGVLDCDGTKPVKALVIRDARTDETAEVYWAAVVYPKTPTGLVSTASIFPQVCQVKANGSVFGYVTINASGAWACTFTTSNGKLIVRNTNNGNTYPIRAGLWHWYVWGVRA